MALLLEGLRQLSPRHNNFILCEVWKRLEGRIPPESEVVKAFTAYERYVQPKKDRRHASRMVPAGGIGIFRLIENT